MKRKLLIAAGIVVVILLVAYFYLLRAGMPAENCTFKLDPERMRKEAEAMVGSKPIDIRVERLTHFRFPRAMIGTGASFDGVDMDVFAYQLIYPQSTIIIDTGMTAADAEKGSGKDYDVAAWGRLANAMRTASAIFVTHEHGDHLGGLLTDKDVWPHARLLPEQKDPGDRLRGKTMPTGAREAFGSLDYEGMTALAPGLVAIRAPGHTPGSQMFYVQKQDGKELLLVGDTAWQMFVIEENLPPPNIVKVLAHIDRPANTCQIAELHALAAADTKIALMPGHDHTRMEQLVKDGIVSKQFKQ